MSNPNVNPGCTETQQMQIKVPAGVRSLTLNPPINHIDGVSRVTSLRFDSGYVSHT